ncbi:MAG: hypothetical protein OEM02_15860 [Desulfobulbaceae bacterium]|nr:hypothetical protein [Desulfobulbaceae bacterium]
MNKLIRILLFVMVGIVLFELLLFRVILPEEPQFREFKGDYFSCLVPESQHASWQQDGWQKNRFVSEVGDLYVSSRILKRSPQEALAFFEQYVHPLYSKDLTVIGPGKFFIQSSGKGRRYVYLFVAGNKLFWLENTRRSSTLRFFKKVLDQVTETLVVDGQGVNSGFSEAVNEIDGEIGWHSHSETAFLLFMLGLPIGLILLIGFPIALYVGRLPTFGDEKPERTEENLFAWVHTPMRYQGTLVSVALFKDRLEVYSWRRPLMVIRQNEGSIEQVAGINKVKVIQGKRSAVIDLPKYIHWLRDLPGHSFLSKE